MNFLMGVGFSAFGLIFNLYLKESGYGERFAGQAVSLNALATGLGAVGAGWISDRIGRRVSILISLGLAGSISAGQSLVLAPGWILGFSFASGAATSLMAVSFSPFLAENSTDRDRIHLFSATAAVGLLSGVTGNLLGGWLPSMWKAAFPATPWTLYYRLTLLTGAGLILISCLPLLGVREEAPARPDGPSRTQASGPMPREVVARIGLFVLVGWFMAFGSGLVVPFLNLFWRDDRHLSDPAIGAVLSGSRVIGFAAILLAPALAARMGRVAMAACLMGLSAPFLLGTALLPGVGPAVASMWLRDACLRMAFPVFSAFQMEAIPPRFRARTASLAGEGGLAWNMAWALSAALFGGIVSRRGYPALFALATACWLAGTSLFYFFFKPRSDRSNIAPPAC